MDSGDLEIVRKQIGRNDITFLRVIRRCSYGFPVVIECYPEKDGKPFPTLYWLTCPHLRQEVSRLEEKGWIKRFEKRIEDSTTMRERMEKAHEEIKNRRERLIRDENLKRLLSEVGSGGIRDFTKVKCLHLHLADYLAGVDNPIGEEIWMMLGMKECEGGRICEELMLGMDTG